MQFEQVRLTDKDLFNNYLSKREHQLITYNFANFFIWRNWDPYFWAEVGNSLVVTSDYNSLDTICVPIAAADADILATTETMIEHYASQNRRFVMSEVSEAMLALYEKYWPGRFEAEEYPEGANYIYLQKDLAELPGKRFNAKRNHINKFRRSYPGYQFQELSSDLIPSCAQLLDTWFHQHDASSYEYQQEYSGSIDGLENFKEIDCQGAALLVDHKVVAFTIGTPLNKDTYAIHIEKADINIHGAYQAINYFFARDFAKGYTYINRAEDMGEAGLRRAKESYYPCRMEKRYYLRLK